MSLSETHEIGIRMALGARPFQWVFGLMGGRTIMLVATGLALGLAGASLALTRFLASHHCGKCRTPTGDPTAYGGALLLVAAVAGLSCIGPLRRCLRIDPVRALRGE